MMRLESVNHAEREAQVAYGVSIAGAGVFHLAGEVETLEGLVGEAGLDAPQVFHVVATAEGVQGVGMLAVVEVAGVADEEAGSPVTGIALHIEPYCIECPITEHHFVAHHTGVDYVAAQRAAFVKAVVEEGLRLKGNTLEGKAAEDRITKRGV